MEIEDTNVNPTMDRVVRVLDLPVGRSILHIITLLDEQNTELDSLRVQIATVRMELVAMTSRRDLLNDQIEGLNQHIVAVNEKLGYEQGRRKQVEAQLAVMVTR